MELARIIERGIKDSRALDTEALCIIAGEKVRITATVLLLFKEQNVLLL